MPVKRIGLTTHLLKFGFINLFADPGVALNLLCVSLPLSEEPDLRTTLAIATLKMRVAAETVRNGAYGRLFWFSNYIPGEPGCRSFYGA